MRIIFICGSLEAGYDGVGDYTCRLASALIANGTEVVALAFNDQYVSEATSQIQTIEGIDINTYRLPSNLSSKQRFILANKWINNINPDWLSLQFVPFSFNTKGLPFKLGAELSKLTENRRWHIMFHELWVGMDDKSTIKHKIWGIFQKILIKSLIKKLKPSLITTQTKLYQIQLKGLGFDADYLSLFSNIPATHFSNFKTTLNNQKKITFVNFGTIHPGAPIISFVKEVALYKQKKGVEFDLILIGRCGNEQTRWINTWKSAGLNIIVLGEQSTSSISKIFGASTFGISTTAFSLIEKSGAVAAMHEHKLPVICVANLWKPKGIKNVPVTLGVIQYLPGNFEVCLTKELNIKYNNVSVVSKQLLKSFSSFN